MNTTLTDQIKSIQWALKFCRQSVEDREHPLTIWERRVECLNDAASTIASLNLTKDLPLIITPQNLTEEEKEEFAKALEERNKQPIIFMPSESEKISALEAKVKTLTHEIEQLILMVEDDAINYSMLEHARKLIFEPK